ncbi:paraquat-inducible protein B [Haloferula luteola]|uniref:Paraquat-inducible protein B n=1 Tax=Haloferula luteola TaxID=595692 RepID=A0A840V8Y6_9BACT|nr:MlaD family protein [Haloferula luteola]MBB5352054.1 paraquat-inducible protein B [Haloferula luteola]
MSHKVNPTAIGMFVTGAIVIAALALIAVGSGKWFREEQHFILYFQGDANGLAVGSDVRIGGVSLGEVEDISIQIDPRTNQKIVPVVIAIDEKRVRRINPDHEDAFDFEEREDQERLVARGLRGRLNQESFVTGALFVELDFLPGEKGFQYEPSLRPDLVQIPTVPATIDKLLETISQSLDKIGNINFSELFDEIGSLVKTTEGKVDALDVEGINRGLLEVTEDLHKVVGNPELKTAVNDLKEAMASLKSASATLDRELDPIAGEFRETLEKANESMARIDGVAENLEDFTSNDGVAVTRINDVLKEFRRTADAWTELADFLKRHPESILSGRE